MTAIEAVIRHREMLRGGDSELKWLLGDHIAGKSRRKIIRLIVRDGYQCVWCGRSLAGDPAATIDHVRPRVESGLNGISNLVLACRSCNTKRGSMSVGRWLRRCRARGYNVQEQIIEAAVRRSRRMHRQKKASGA